MLKLVTSNIEGDVHLDLVQQFLANQKTDVVCLQEVFEQDLPALLGKGFQSAFLPMCLKVNRDGVSLPWGVAIASRLPVNSAHTHYYRKAAEDIIAYDHRDKHATLSYGIAGMRFVVEGAPVNIITTHFTWTPDGLPDTSQDADMSAMLQLLANQPPHILCGDFNIPRRQNRHYVTLTKHYTDHVPQEVASSIHVPMHYARHKPGVAEKLSALMVDYIFSTPNSYRIDDVTMHGGISDHCAISAEITPTVQSQCRNFTSM